MTVPGEKDLKVIQGLVARNYDGMTHVCHSILKVNDPIAGKSFIRDLAPRVTTATENGAAMCFNLGFTFEGLKALGLTKECEKLQSKPELQSFVRGATARAEIVGDVRENAPRVWKDGLGKPGNAHILLSIYAKDRDALLKEIKELLPPTDKIDEKLQIVSSTHGAELGNGLIHFGYKDGISQPNVIGLPKRKTDDGQKESPAGAFLLGYTSQFSDHTYDFDFPEDLGRNGTFAAFRIMKQDVHAFEEFLTQQAGPKGNRELVAARMCGRWRDGTPLTLSPEEPGNNPTNNFNYAGDAGQACPFNAHIRRTNPRDDKVAGLSGQNHRVIRSTMPYGPLYEDKQDNYERGLMGLFFCVNLTDQFEFVMKNWVNRGGFQGHLPATDSDPLIGLQSFVRTRGAAYCFYPSLDGLRYIALDK